jgi:hypothetical protein
MISSPDLPEDEGQPGGRATHVASKMSNDELCNSEYRPDAINGGNDRGGMFLTQPECEAARGSLPRAQDWPYLPTLEHPWYGRHQG